MVLILIHRFLPCSTSINAIESVDLPWKNVLPTDRFDLFWIISTWNSSDSLRRRHFLVFQSILIHHPNATVIYLAVKLTETEFFSSLRQRGYRIYSFEFSTLTENSKYFILYFYGGTFLNIDVVLLRRLPRHEFIGFTRNSFQDHVSTNFMRFLPSRNFLRSILSDDEFTEHVIFLRSRNGNELKNVKFYETSRLFALNESEISSIYHRLDFDPSLRWIVLTKKSFALKLFDHSNQRQTVAQGSLIDFLIDRFDLGASQINSTLIFPSIYVHNELKQGRFIGEDTIFFRTDSTSIERNHRWNLTIQLQSLRIFLHLTQAEINYRLNEIIYDNQSGKSSEILKINVNDEYRSISCSIKILIFHRWVSVLTKTMGTKDRWPSMERLAISVEKYFPRTILHIASDAEQIINKHEFLNFSKLNEFQRHSLNETLIFHPIRFDSGLSKGRNILIDRCQTEFFFIMDDDFTFDEDSHLDLLLKFIYADHSIDIITGKIPEDIETFDDYSGIFLIYNQTLELKHGSIDRFQSLNRTSTNPCRQVDFVPNAFMGRTRTIRKVRWDEQLKLGEHEDFFLRFQQANRTVFTCEHIFIHHHQQAWWKFTETAYYQQRARVFQFYQQMLIKHHFKRLVTFDLVNIDLEVLPMKKH